MLLAGLNKTTLLDYPERVAATVFTGGCNFRCPFCHNAGLVLNPAEQELFSEEEVLDFLKKRRSILSGVCLTGGEPALQADLPDFIRKIKELSYAVKLDTNGYYPEMLQMLVEEGLIDYVAMDVKNCRERYSSTVGMDRLELGRIEQSIEFLKQGRLDYEFRTTVVKELHREEDLLKLGEWIKGCPRYYLQKYRDDENVLGEGFHAYEDEEMKRLAGKIQNIFKATGIVSVRGCD